MREPETVEPAVLRSPAVAALLWTLCGLSAGLPLTGATEAGGVARRPLLEIEPVEVLEDAGPSTLFGASKTNPEGTHFIWADLTLTGPAQQYRLYFDRKDNRQFHFLERRGRLLRLGIFEEGVEQVFVKTALPDEIPDSELARLTLRVARHGSQIGVFLADRLLTWAFDDRLRGGTAGLRLLSGGEAGGDLKFEVKPREDILFSDDFMREEKDSFVWRNGKEGKGCGSFQVKSLRNFLLSANAFCFMGSGADALSVVGQPWWDQYHFEASLWGPEESKVGLVFAYRDEANYGLFRWSARTLGPDGAPRGQGTQELVRIADGKEVVLATRQGGFLPNQWYRGEVLLGYSQLEIRIDGHTFFRVRDPGLACGAAGVWCSTPQLTRKLEDPRNQNSSINSLHELMLQHAVFDDVSVRSQERIQEDFRCAGELGQGWMVGTGSWQVTVPGPEKDGELRVAPASGVTKSLIGNQDWSQYRVRCAVDPGPGEGGILFLYRDESNYFLARLDQKELCLLRMKDGQEEVLDRAPRAKGQDAFAALATSIQHGHIRVEQEGGPVVEFFEESPGLRGRAGLWAGAGAEPGAIRFRGFQLDFLNDPEPLVTSNAVFEHEDQYMGNWTDPKSEWYPQSQDFQVGEQKIVPMWHRSQFPGDVELVVEPREVLEDTHEIALALAKNGKGTYNGYTFRYQAGQLNATGDRITLLKLLRQGETVLAKELPAGAVRELSSVSFRHAGGYVLGKVNGRTVLSYRDPQPLKGSKVAYYTSGIEARAESSKILSRDFHNELFSGAPTLWRTAGAAIFQVTNRWQCDPRWTFACLENDRARGKAAALWSKKRYLGDVTLELFAGNKMDGARGRPYAYARDINITICSDGEDLSKGYTFMFGGQGNIGSMIYRNGVEVKRVSSATIPTSMNFHRHWFAIRVEKRGNRLAFRVDRYFQGEPQQELVYEDPQPLTGDRVCLWTYDHGIMISRARISGESSPELEDPNLEFRPLRTPYDQPAP